MQVEGSLGTNLPLQNKCKEYSNTTKHHRKCLFIVFKFQRKSLTLKISIIATLYHQDTSESIDALMLQLLHIYW